MLQTLARWNRWGTARLDPGIARDAAAEMRPFLDTPEVVALAGPRRAGKTTLLYQLMDAVEAAGAPPEACLHVNFEEPGLGPELGLALLDRIYDTYRTEVRPNGRAYLFLDEIQHVPSWERWVRARKETEDIKLFVTGSSSALMTREFGSLLTGRHVTFRVWPLGFGEFLRFKSIAAPRRPKLAGSPAPMLNALGEFMRWGGFPEVVLAEDGARKEALLKQYFEDLLFKDVALRHALRDASTLRNLAVHLLTQSACLVSYQRLARTFGVSLDLTRAYCGHLQEAFLVDFLPFFSLKAAERQRRPQKVHAVDVGLRRVVSLSASEDRGRTAETVVHGALVRRPNDGLFYWRGQGEVDLVVRRANQATDLVQVVFEAGERAVLARELRGLADAAAVFPAAARTLVVASGELPGISTEDPARAVPLWQFLLES